MLQFNIYFDILSLLVTFAGSNELIFSGEKKRT